MAAQKGLDAALVPSDLGPRGEALWKALMPPNVVDSQRAVLAAEACRMADRLDQLDLLIRGDVGTWCRITEDRSGDLEVSLNAAATEARQLTNVFRQLMGQLAGQSVGKAGGSVADELAKARAARKSRAAG